MPAFKIGINMAGAVSAGAYTAGVLDFLTEALDEWYKAKVRGEAVPPHDVSIEVFTGASAGGMCAAISSLMLQEEFDHVHDTAATATVNNPLYESWVNKIDIRELLKTDDLQNASRVVSLLDSTIIQQIASSALSPKRLLDTPRPYVSPTLTLFLSLTNLRGIPYSLNGAAPGSIEESTLFFGDRIRFETVSAGSTSTKASSAYKLDPSKTGPDGGWDVLQTAAMATGAFPIFLAPHLLNRKLREYTPPMWESVTSALSGTPPPIPPNFPADLAEPMVTLNVDGGITNNDPFNYAHDYVCSLQPSVPAGTPDTAMAADRAVISIAPFPTANKFDVIFEPVKKSSVFSALPLLFSALVSQSRFFGESLNQIMSGTTFTRFVIAPSDPEQPSDSPVPALQCAALSAFGGFFERGFRAHDYILGRRNCQKFLCDYFVLPADNVVMKPALDSLTPAARDALTRRYARRAPGTYSQPEKDLAKMGKSVPDAQKTTSDVWLPIIPLCSDSVSKPIAPVARAQMNGDSLNQIIKLILSRYGALVGIFLDQIAFLPLRLFLKTGQPVIRRMMRRPLRDLLIRKLGDSYKP